MNTEDLIKNKIGTVVDVRTTEEFGGGSVVGAVNVPLNELPVRLEEVRKLKSPLILCCASGNRSGQAEDFLISQGVECVNGGSWLDVNYLTSQSL